MPFESSPHFLARNAPAVFSQTGAQVLHLPPDRRGPSSVGGVNWPRSAAGRLSGRLTVDLVYTQRKPPDTPSDFAGNSKDPAKDCKETTK